MKKIIDALKNELREHPKLSVSRLLMLVQFSGHEYTAAEFAEIAGFTSVKYSRNILDEAVDARQLEKFEIETDNANTRYGYALTNDSINLLKKLGWYHGN